MNVERVFAKPKLLRALARLDAGESEWLLGPLYPGHPVPGSVHDKKLADQSKRRFPPPTRCWLKDSGPQGCKPPGFRTLQLKSSRRGGNSAPNQKAITRVGSHARFLVEDATADIKPCRMGARKPCAAGGRVWRAKRCLPLAACATREGRRVAA